MFQNINTKRCDIMSNDTKQKNATKNATQSKQFTIAQLCREYNQNAKIIRSRIRKLFVTNDDARKLIDSNDKNATHRYTYDISLRDQFIELLKFDESMKTQHDE